MTNSTIEYTDSKENKYPSRSSRNSRLYREVYGKYEDLDNLPIEDNTDEIDLERLREIVYDSQNTKEHRELKENLDILDVRKRNIDQKRIYDINQILEKAKYENNKLKEPIATTTKHNGNILSTLQLETITTEIEDKFTDEPIQKTFEENDNIYMTREFKFKELNEKISELNASFNPLIDNVMSNSDLSLELFEDLKPTGNTIITKPITESNNYQGDMHSSDTSDIDIIKSEITTAKKEEEFFTNSYEFTKKDFSIEEQDDFFDENKNSSNIFKIILLLLAIAIFTFVIVYFILNYGIGI